MSEKRVDFDYEVGEKILIVKDGILRKVQSPKQKEPWTISQVHTIGTIRVTPGTRLERLNIWRVEPFFENGHKTIETKLNQIVVSILKKTYALFVVI